MARKKKTTQGRKKIAIKKIENEEARHVCFSKRRNGAFTKAADLATLCGAEVAVLVNSLGGNPYSFGSPGVAQVTQRFLSGDKNPVIPTTDNNQYPDQNINLVQELNFQCMEFSRRVDMSNKMKSTMEERMESLVDMNPICKLNEEMEGLGDGEIQAVENVLMGVRVRAEARIRELMRNVAVGASTSANNATSGVASGGHGVGFENGNQVYEWENNNFGYGPRYY